jgi:two-component system nitrate/nitrite response regulator NarL
MVPDFSFLSSRERQVSNLICCGDSNKIIGRKLNIREGTVKQHAHAIYRKLGVRNRSEIVIRFAEFDTR